jgi:6,7-dimethyl-8-ribityllumazine synthase
MGGRNSAGIVAPDCSGKRFAIVVARFHREVSDALVDGAKRGLHDCRVSDDDISLYEVPGCFELPLACRKVIDTDHFEGVVALGAVVRGETPHFTYVAGECSRGLMDVQLATSTPIGFGVLTTDTLDQARERAVRAGGDKGYDAAFAAALLTTIPANVARAGFRRDWRISGA